MADVKVLPNREYNKLTRLEQKQVAQNFVCALKQCSKTRDLEGGKKLHADAVDANCHTDKYLAAALINMYTKCGSMKCARQVFDNATHRTVVTWNSLLMGYVENGESSIAMNLFTRMDCQPTHVTFVAVLKACACLAAERLSEKQVWLEKGITLHKRVKSLGLDSEIVVVSTLVDMYGKCGCMQRARQVFERAAHRTTVTWNCLLLGYVENGESYIAMDLFNKMGCEPTHVTYVAALKACSALGMTRESEKKLWLDKGIALHKQVKDRGFDSDMLVASTLLDMYGKCGSMQRARNVFDMMKYKDVVVWTCLLLGYVENGEVSTAIDMFSKMDCEPDSFTYVVALKAVAVQASERVSEKHLCINQVKTIHEHIKARKYASNLIVANTLVDTYCKCGGMQLARGVFESTIDRDEVTWNSLLLGYVENGESSVAIDLFIKMDCEPTYVTYVAALKACSSLGELPVGEWIHARVCALGLEENEMVANTLVDFYGKCGNIAKAEQLFMSMHTPDLVSWNALLWGYSSLGDSSHVFSMGDKIHEAGLQMDGVTFIRFLTMCSHGGQVEEGKKYFEKMLSYGISPGVEHYNCMIDMLGRANRLEEALSIANSMPFEANAVTWSTLLGACKKWKNLKVGKVAFDALLDAGVKDTTAYVLMRDIYGSLNMWEERERMEAKRKTGPTLGQRWWYEGNTF